MERNDPILIAFVKPFYELVVMPFKKSFIISYMNNKPE